ncbi:MAG: hypothetical protein V2A54_06075 [Bacteroidota bacterium]
MEKRKCMECAQEIIGRIDKKFCDDQCRNAYNNRLNSDSTNRIRNINGLLRKNRRILSALAPDGKGKVHKDKLISKGFNLNYHTHTYTTRKNDTYYYCYDYGYLPIQGDYYFIVMSSLEE